MAAHQGSATAAGAVGIEPVRREVEGGNEIAFRKVPKADASNTRQEENSLNKPNAAGNKPNSDARTNTSQDESNTRTGNKPGNTGASNTSRNRHSYEDFGDAGNTGIRDGDILERGARAGSTDGGITIEEVAAEIARAGLGPALALKAYLEKPNAERLKYLMCAVLVCKGMDPTGWEKHGNAAKAAAFDSHNHPLDCDCEQCV